MMLRKQYNLSHFIKTFLMYIKLHERTVKKNSERNGKEVTHEWRQKLTKQLINSIIYTISSKSARNSLCIYFLVRCYL